VLENPDDDMPRLVLCDWWEENGKSKEAEFVRRQIHAHGVGRYCLKPPPDVLNLPAPKHRCRCENCRNYRTMQTMSVQKAERWKFDYEAEAQSRWREGDRVYERLEANQRLFGNGVLSLDQVTQNAANIWAQAPYVEFRTDRGFIKVVICNESFVRYGLEKVMSEHPVQNVSMIGTNGSSNQAWIRKGHSWQGYYDYGVFSAKTRDEIVKATIDLLREFALTYTAA
jgi:uncharacterized protein (TIGR02996 family)